MQITDRDKKLLILLLMICVAFLYYQFVYLNNAKTIDRLKLQKNALIDKLGQVNLEMKKANEGKERYSETHKEFDELNNKLPPNQNQMFSLLDLQKLSGYFNIKLNDYSITSGKEENSKVYYFSFRQRWQISYDDFKRLLSVQKTFYPLFSITSATLTNAGDKLDVNFEIRFYGFDDPFAPKRQLPSFSTGLGKHDLFK